MERKYASRNIVILVADDEKDDCLTIHDALKENGLDVEVHFVYDGKELMLALYRSREPGTFPVMLRPDLILLGLNMPQKDGNEVLLEIKNNPKLESIPAVVLSNSNDSRDIEFCGRAGASDFITKPMGYRNWITAMRVVRKHLFDSEPEQSRTAPDDAPEHRTIESAPRNNEVSPDK